MNASVGRIIAAQTMIPDRGGDAESQLEARAVFIALKPSRWRLLRARRDFDTTFGERISRARGREILISEPRALGSFWRA